MYKSLCKTDCASTNCFYFISSQTQQFSHARLHRPSLTHCKATLGQEQALIVNSELALCVSGYIHILLSKLNIWQSLKRWRNDEFMKLRLDPVWAGFIICTSHSRVFKVQWDCFFSFFRSWCTSFSVTCLYTDCTDLKMNKIIFNM